MFGTLFVNEKGEIYSHPEYAMLGRSGGQWLEPGQGEMIPLPKGSTLVSMPGYLAVGCSKDGKPGAVEENPYNGEKVWPVAALLPQGFTRTLLPAAVPGPGASELPLFGYAAVGFKGEQTFVAAIQSDEYRTWHPVHYNTSGLAQRVKAILKRFPDNRIYHQLAHCALDYSCFTAQNIFYRRWEGGIPSMPKCNARCLGCISRKHGQAQSPQNRLDFVADWQEISQVCTMHLEKAPRAMVSFGQGCEGEPALNAENIARSIRAVRQNTEKGTINMNSNAGYTEGIRQLCEAGLQNLRVTMFSASNEDYLKYHRPEGFDLKEVADSIACARDNGVYVSINLLTFPGFTDRPFQVEALQNFIQKTSVDMVQIRNLNIDPDRLMREFPSDEPGIGIVDFLYHLQNTFPGLCLGSYNHLHPRAL
ncbi:MAG: radical SAM protein [Syntrophomonas sp.]